jgi:predicted ATPase
MRTFLGLSTGDFAVAERSESMLIDLATTHGLTLWASLGWCLKGTLLIKRGEVEVGSILLRTAVDAFRSTGQSVHLSGCLPDLAEGLAAVGRLAEALATITEAVARHERDGQLWCVAELRRVNGELLFLEGGSQAVSAAEDCFVGSLDMAGRQSSLFWELRAAMSLARLRVRQNRQDEARHLLAPV